MPYLCNMDYVMLGILGIPIFREHICLDDGDLCDFKIRAGKADGILAACIHTGKIYNFSCLQELTAV